MVWFDVNEHRPDLVPVERVGGGDKSERGGNHFTSYPHPLQAELERQSPVVEETHIVGL